MTKQAIAAGCAALALAGAIGAGYWVQARVPDASRSAKSEPAAAADSGTGRPRAVVDAGSRPKPVARRPRAGGGPRAGSDAPADLATERERHAPAVAERIAELTSLVERDEYAALPSLLDSVLPEQPELAPTIILTVAKLAALAAEAERDAAARRLSDWLRLESARDGRDARGNAAVLIEALGMVDSPHSVDALSAALDRQDLPLHLETLAVHALFELGDGRALTSVLRWNERVASLPAGSGLQEALRREAELTAAATLASLGS